MADVEPILPWLQPGWVGVEIGVSRGLSSKVLLDRANVRYLYLIDPWKPHDEYIETLGTSLDYWEAIYRECYRRVISQYPSRHAVLRMSSAEAARFVPPALDFVWIDGNHRYEWVKSDMELYWPKIKRGGILCGHDYVDSPPSCGVKQAVDEFAAKHSLSLEVSGGCWIIKKTTATLKPDAAGEEYLGKWHAIARRHGASKADHTYMPHYERLLSGLVGQPLNILEIGIGDGGCLEMWRELFPGSNIFGVDIAYGEGWKNPDATVYIMRQEDPALASYFPAESLDIVVDDASHQFDAQKACLQSLWPALKPGGWYFIEDITDLNSIRHWGTFERFRVCMDYLRQSDRRTQSLDDVLIVLRKPPCPMPWEW